MTAVDHPNSRYAVHGGGRTEETPTRDRHDVAIAQRRVVHEGKIQEIRSSRGNAYNFVHQGPGHDLQRVRCHQDAYHR